MEAEERPCGDVLLMVLEALKKACHEIETDPQCATLVKPDIGAGAGASGSSHSPSVKALLELQAGSDYLLAGDHHLSSLSQRLSDFKSLVSTIRSSADEAGHRRGFLCSLIRWRSKNVREISRVAGAIGMEIQYWIDRECTNRLVYALRPPAASAAAAEDEQAALLATLEARVSQGFDHRLQEVLLQLGAFATVESALADPEAARSVREGAAAAALALVRFNKAVFVGPVLMGPTVGALLAAGASASPVEVRALRGLVSAIRSPLVDELLARGHISHLVGLLAIDCAWGGGGADRSFDVQVAALECALEIGYCGRKEAIDAMLAEGLVKRLVELQRSEFGGALIEMENVGADEGEERRGMRRRKRDEDDERWFMETRPFASCVTRWSIQVEVGEGLRGREKRAVKKEIVEQVRRAAVDEAEAATVLTEVLWGPTIWT